MLEDFQKLFSTGYEGTDNMFYFFFIKLLFSMLTKRKTIYKAHECILYFFHETVNSIYFQTANHIAQIIFVLQFIKSH